MQQSDAPAKSVAHLVKRAIQKCRFWDAPYIRRRRRVARQVLRGSGIEIGALHNPLKVPAWVKVSFVDRMGVDDLRAQYPELADKPLVTVDVIDDGERLGKFAAGSQDFVIANHFLEHTQDPIGTLESHLRVLKPGGILYMAIPNRHVTFDKDRPPTPWEHFVKDHVEGAAWSFEDHLIEYVELVEKRTGQDRDDRLRDMKRINYSIHFHVWNEAEFRSFLDKSIEQFKLPCEVQYCQHLQVEILAILRKK